MPLTPVILCYKATCDDCGEDSDIDHGTEASAVQVLRALGWRVDLFANVVRCPDCREKQRQQPPPPAIQGHTYLSPAERPADGSIGPYGERRTQGASTVAAIELPDQKEVPDAS